MNNFTSAFVFVLVFVCAMLGGFGAHAEILATVGTTQITAEDFNRKMLEVRSQTANPPSAAQLLEDIVRFELGVQEAQKENLPNEPVIKERYKQILYDGLLEKQLGKSIEDIKITESQMRDFYKKNPEIRIAHILLDVKASAAPEEREAIKKHALAILDEVKKSKHTFEDSARLNSGDVATKDLGGDIGVQARQTLLPPLYDAAVTMKVGEVRGLIETPYGYHIIKLLELRAFDLADKRQVRAELFDERRAKIFQDYFDKLKKQYKVNVNRGALKSLAH